MSRSWGAAEFWDDDATGQLFLFHLHGFTALATYAASERTPHGDAFWAEVVGHWLARHERPRLPSWHPYPTSQRIIAWAAALSAVEGWPPSLRSRLAAELARQGRYLRRAVEHDIGGNHVLKNATALIFAGAVVPASTLLAPGLRLLEAEVASQFLSDGGHEERSTSYHRIVLHDLGEVAELLQRIDEGVPGWLSETIEIAQTWQRAMTGPDGALPLLNDAWEGPSLSRRVEEPLTHLRESGYLVFRHRHDQAIFDVGPLSPPHLPPHAHADALSFVVWAEGRPLIVDPGSYTYTGPWRYYFRATSAHNTVEIDSRDQCELWGDFRIAYPPRVRVHAVRRHESAWVTTASHDGYRRLGDPVEHHRAFVWLAGKGIVVVDRLRARAAHGVRSRLHLAPDAPVEGTSRLGPFALVSLAVGADLRCAEVAYAPFLGRKVGARVIEDVRTVEPDTPFGWSLLRSGVRVTRLGLDHVEVTGPGEPTSTIPLDWA